MNIHHGGNLFRAQALGLKQQVVAIHVALIIHLDVPVLPIEGEGENFVERVTGVGEIGYAHQSVYRSGGIVLYRAGEGYFIAIVF